MIDHGPFPEPDAEQSQVQAPAITEPETPEVVESPNRGRSLKYGQVPIAEGASGRRARLRHPSRGAVRR